MNPPDTVRNSSVPHSTTQDAVVHLVADGHGTALCCGRTLFELPRGERVTVDPQAATCRGLP